MSDPTQAQAEDRRAQIQARIKEWFGKEWPCDSGAQQWDEFEQRLQCASCGYPEPDHLLREAFDELTRLSRVEQALREALATIATTGGRHYDGCGCSVCIARAALSASPEAQPEEGR